jgi:cysteine desulfurase
MTNLLGRNAVIYFDYNATTPLDPRAREAMDAATEIGWANPSSVHGLGRAARAILDKARRDLAAMCACKPSEIVFTSGGTEANNAAVFGAARSLPAGSAVAVGATEHHAVLHAYDVLERREGFRVVRLPVDARGVVAIDALDSALRGGVRLVSVMAANNETGVIQPFAEIGRLCRAHGALFHTDAVQVFGKLPFSGARSFEADLVTLCAHKFHGPKGAGALILKSPIAFTASQVGGGHENERRAGTENLPAIAGLVAAFERCVMTPAFPAETLLDWTRRLAAAAASILGVTVRGDDGARLPNTVAFTVKGADSIALIANLDLEGVAASSGSACTAGALEPSHVLAAMGVPADEANALVRFSLGRGTKEEEVATVCSLLPKVVERARAR